MFFKRNRNKRRSDLEEALVKSKQYGERGYAQAEKAVDLLKKVIDENVSGLNRTIHDLEKNNYRDNEATDLLQNQLIKIKEDFESLPILLQREVDRLSKEVFSITLFGRTMAGKSTLMEILIKGDGSSIGKGAQRTTRNVREYAYKDTGMVITDVPGIAAFDGKEDEELAYKAAAKGDLILFLITDDAPQEAETECLRRIVSLGKPVICLINVRASINTKNDIPLFKRDIEKKLHQDRTRLDEIKKQFINYGKKYGQNWQKIPFTYVHLKSAFVAQQEEFEEYSAELYRLSCFSRVERLIEEEVIKNGPFYKTKAFLDVASNNLLKTLRELFGQSNLNSEHGRLLIRKNRELKEKLERITDMSHKKVNAFKVKVQTDLKNQIPEFAEEHYDDKNAGNKWKRVVDDYDIASKVEKVLTEIQNNYKREVEEISRELRYELDYVSEYTKDKAIDMDTLINTSRILGWASTIALAISSCFTGIVSAVIGIGITILSAIGLSFVDDQEKRIRDAQAKLQRKLNRDVENYTARIVKEMNKEVDKIARTTRKLNYSLNGIVDTFFTLSETQQKLAIELDDELLGLNKAVIDEALDYLEDSKASEKIYLVARDPGNALLLVLKDGEVFPNDTKKRLENLMKEKVWFSFHKNDVHQMTRMILGKGIHSTIEYIGGMPRIVHIKDYDQLDTIQKTRITLAQQVTRLLFMKG